MIRFVRFTLTCVCLVVAGLSIGCAGPMGPGCGDGNCYDCDGTAGQPIPYGPLDSLRQFKREMVCGSGCGETYMGEWISTPPDAVDPCCGDQWVGGATACRPFCFQWQPGSLLMGLQGLYGGRYCTGAESSAPCGCDMGGGCDGGCGDGFIDGGYVDGGYIDGGCAGGNCGGGCSTCSSQSMGSTRMARMSNIGRAPVDPRMDPRVQRIRR